MSSKSPQRGPIIIKVTGSYQTPMIDLTVSSDDDDCEYEIGQTVVRKRWKSRSRSPVRSALKQEEDDDDDMIVDSDDNDPESLQLQQQVNEIANNLSIDTEDEENPPILTMDAYAPIPTTSRIGIHSMPRILPMISPPLLISPPPFDPYDFISYLDEEPTPPPPTVPPKRRRSYTTNRFSQGQITALNDAYQGCNGSVNALVILELMTETQLAKEQIRAYFAKLKRLEKPNQPSFNNDNDNNFDNQQQKQTQNSTTESPPTDNNTTNSTQEARGYSADPARTHLTDSNLTTEEITATLQERRAKILTFKMDQFKRALNKCWDACCYLIKCFQTKDTLSARLVKETMRIKEKSWSSVLLFSDEQKSAISEFRGLLLEQKLQKVKSQFKIDQIKSADMIVVRYWLPVLVYGKLNNLSISEAVKDFMFNSRDRREFSGDTDALIFPGIIHYNNKRMRRDRKGEP